MHKGPTTKQKTAGQFLDLLQPQIHKTEFLVTQCGFTDPSNWNLTRANGILFYQNKNHIHQ